MRELQDMLDGMVEGVGSVKLVVRCGILSSVLAEVVGEDDGEVVLAPDCATAMMAIGNTIVEALAALNELAALPSAHEGGAVS